MIQAGAPSERLDISLVRFVSIVAMVCAHSPTPGRAMSHFAAGGDPFSADPAAYDIVLAQDGLARISSPLLGHLRKPLRA